MGRQGLYIYALRNLRKTIFLLFIGSLLSCGILKRDWNKVPYNQEDIKRMAEWKFGYDLTEINFCDLYILDGIPYDQHTIDTVLARYTKTDFSRITFIKETKERTYLHKPCGLFVVLSTAQQTTEEKEALLKEITDFYNEKLPEVRIRDFRCETCKALSVNGLFPMLPYDAKEFLNSIKVDQIKHIAIYDEPLNVDFFGSAHKNGLIEITLN